MANKREPMPSWNSIRNETVGPEGKKVKYWLDVLLKEEDPDSSAEEGTGFEVDNPSSSTTMFTTTSSNPARPRTIRAGYDFSEQKLVVVFRDGTWYEYRGVPESMWYDFQMADSKGTFLRESGLDTWQDKGPANVSSMSKGQRAQMANLKEFTNYMYSESKEQ